MDPVKHQITYYRKVIFFYIFILVTIFNWSHFIGYSYHNFCSVWQSCLISPTLRSICPHCYKQQDRINWPFVSITNRKYGFMMSLHVTCILLSSTKRNISDYCSVVITFRLNISIFCYKLRFLFSPGMSKRILSLIFHTKLGYIIVSHVK